MSKKGGIVRLVEHNLKRMMEGRKYREGYADGYHAALMEMTQKVDLMSLKFAQEDEESCSTE